MANRNKKSINPQNSVKKHRSGIIITIIAVVAVLALLFSIGIAFSWFDPSSELSALTNTKVTNFSATLLRSFNGTDYDVLNKDAVADDPSKYEKIIVSGDNTNVDKLSLKLRYEGESSAYVKVQLFESFYNSDGDLIPSADVIYTVNDKYWRKASDGCFYSIAPLSQLVDNSNGVSSPLDLAFVTNVECTYDNTDGIYFNLAAVIETVQPDRFDEFFGTDATETTTAETTS